jgi:hypothetical protein
VLKGLESLKGVDQIIEESEASISKDTRLYLFYKLSQELQIAADNTNIDPKNRLKRIYDTTSTTEYDELIISKINELVSRLKDISISSDQKLFLKSAILKATGKEIDL